MNVNMTTRRLSKLFLILFVFWPLSKSCWGFAAGDGRKETSFSKYRERSAAKKQPNIVFVLVDDLGFHDVGYHGSKMKTPTMNKLAADGVKLENYYVQHLCSPTRCTLLSGRYLIHTGMQHFVIAGDQPTALPRNSPTIADKMKEAGYATHAVGKWHMGFYKEEFMPHHRGFDTFFGFLNAAEGYYKHTVHYPPNRKDLQYLDFRFNDEPIRNMTGKYSTHIFTQRAQNIISAHDKSKPLFLYLPYQAVHYPMQVPEKYEKPFEGIIHDKLRKTYAGMLLALDEGIANITKTLKDEGLWDDTILVLSTDNGGYPKHGGSNYPLRGEKYTLWEGGIRGVGFVSGGKNIKLARGTSTSGLMHVSDWFPTLVSVAGGSLNGTLPLDGVNNWDMLSRGVASKRSVLLHNIDPLEHPMGKRKYPNLFDTRVRAAIRVGDYKLITGYPGTQLVPPPKTDKNVWLFNITADPSETTDLSDKRPEVVKQMLVTLGKVNATSVPAYYPPHNPKADPKLHGGVWGPWL